MLVIARGKEKKKDYERVHGAEEIISVTVQKNEEMKT